MAKKKVWKSGFSIIADSSFPVQEVAILRGSVLSWILGGLIFLVAIVVASRNILGTPEGSVIGNGDAECWLWRYWWMKQVMSAAWAEGGFFYALYTFFIAGSYPEFGNVLDLQVFSWPLEFLFGDSYYTIKIVLILFLNCMACWWFLSYVWGVGVNSWCGALIFGMNPYFITEIAAGRVRQAIAFTIPIFLLFLYRSWRHGDNKSVILAGVFMGLTAAFYLYYGMFLGFFWIMFLVWHYVSGHRMEHAAGFARKMMAIAFIGILVALPFSLSYIEQALHGELVQLVPYGSACPSLAELTDSRAAQSALDLVPGARKRLADDSLPLDAFWSYRIHYAMPFIALIIIFIPWKIPNKMPWLWAISFFVFLVLSFGPYLSLGEADRIIISNVRMPFAFFYRWVPFFSRLLSPNRLMAMAYMSLSILFLIRMAEYSKNSAELSRIIGIITGIGMLAQMELIGTLPLEVSHPDQAAYYYLLRELKPVGIIEVPFRTGDYIDFNQIAHCQKSLGSFSEGGLPPRFPQCRLSFIAKKEDFSQNTFLIHLKLLNDNPFMPQNYREADKQELVKAGFRLLILHQRGCDMIDALRGEIIYFKLYEHFCKVLGKPILDTNEQVYPGMKGRLEGDTSDPAWYRMSVFDLTGAGVQK
ncbi:MAG: hypothetical protein K6G50_13495 [bacterium]|nr:hypothetical protein [bacterium]